MVTTMNDLKEPKETVQFSLKSGGYVRRKKVLLLSIWYPLAISRYFEKAFADRDDVDLRTVGPYTGNKIPWKGGMELPLKYAKCPTYPMFNMTNNVPWFMVEHLLNDWNPDLIVCVDAGINWEKNPRKESSKITCPVVTIATDPHVLSYDHAREVSDHLFNMQACYSKPGDIYLPYAFSMFDHYRQLEENKFDAVLIGMPYTQRVAWVQALHNRGISVAFENGPVFEEYRALNNQANIGLNWSSMNDLVARVFEIMAMGLCPVINRVPDLDKFFVENEDYLAFSSLQEACEKVQLAKDFPELRDEISRNAYNKMWKLNDDGYPQHSYSARVEQIFQFLGLNNDR